MLYLLDTDWAINSLTGKRQAPTIIKQLSPHGVAISWVSIGELYEIAFNSPNPSAHLKSLNEFLLPLTILNLNREIMKKFAESGTKSMVN